jgi:hypothetical protein
MISPRRTPSRRRLVNSMGEVYAESRRQIERNSRDIHGVAYGAVALLRVPADGYTMPLSPQLPHPKFGLKSPQFAPIKGHVLANLSTPKACLLFFPWKRFLFCGYEG